MSGIAPLAEVRDEPLLLHAVRAVRECADSVQVRTGPELLDPCSTALRPVTGSWLSIVDSAAALPKQADVLLVHDPLRAFTPAAVIAAAMDAVRSGAAAAVPVRPVTDTIKAVDGAGFVQRTWDRDQLRTIQSPQCFNAAALPRLDTLPDVRHLPAHDVHTVPGDPLGMRVESTFDHTVIKALLESTPC